MSYACVHTRTPPPAPNNANTYLEDVFTFETSLCFYILCFLLSYVACQILTCNLKTKCNKTMIVAGFAHASLTLGLTLGLTLRSRFGLYEIAKPQKYTCGSLTLTLTLRSRSHSRFRKPSQAVCANQCNGAAGCTATGAARWRCSAS